MSKCLFMVVHDRQCEALVQIMCIYHCINVDVKMKELYLQVPLHGGQEPRTSRGQTSQSETQLCGVSAQTVAAQTKLLLIRQQTVQIKIFLPLVILGLGLQLRVECVLLPAQQGDGGVLEPVQKKPSSKVRVRSARQTGSSSAAQTCQ